MKVADIQLYEHFLQRQCIKYYSRFYLKHKGVIPVLDTGNSTANEHIRQLHNKGWISVSSTGMTPFVVFNKLAS